MEFFNFSLRMPNVCAIIIKRTYVRKEEGRYVDCFRIQKEKTLYEKLSNAALDCMYFQRHSEKGRRNWNRELRESRDLPQFYAGRTVRLPLKDPVYQ